MRHDVVVVEHGAQDPGEDLLARHLPHELHLGRREVDVGGEDVEAVDPGRLDHLMDVVTPLDEQVVDRHLELVGRDAQPYRGALRVEVDEEHPPAGLGQGRTELIVVVLPTPPFWLHIAMMRAGPCDANGWGWGNSGSGRPVGPHLSGGADGERRVGIQLSPRCRWC